jgi:hypothetical protein
MARKRKQQLSESMSFEEMSKLPRKEFIDRMAKLQNKSLQEMTDFGDPAYAGYTFEQKVKFWESSLHQQMRRQVESGLNAYGIFSYHWYQAVLKLEPQFELIMDQVLKSPTWEEWNKDEIIERIKNKDFK